jgi:hypothetical protein
MFQINALSSQKSDFRSIHWIEQKQITVHEARNSHPSSSIRDSWPCPSEINRKKWLWSRRIVASEKSGDENMDVEPKNEEMVEKPKEDISRVAVIVTIVVLGALKLVFF